MPHSTSPEASPKSEEEDGLLPDAPPVDPSDVEEAESDGSNDALMIPVEATKDSIKTDIMPEDLFDYDEDEDDEFSSSGLPANGKVETVEATKVPNKIKVKLEDMFDDDEDEDAEFPTSSLPANEKMESSPAATAPLPLHPPDGLTDPGVMLAFYQRVFPFRYLFQWLNHAIKPSNDFGHREFAFTLPNNAYLRYQSFQSSDLLRKDVIRLNPSRFEIGPIYTANPRDRKILHKSTAFRPVSKELVFDIDLTDYDEIRTCCNEANICHKCWSFVTMAIKVLDAALRQDFGFEHVMWVYSGRRGAHAWISDKRARILDDAKRKAIAGYLEVVKGGAQSVKKVNVKRPLHPHLARSLDILKAHFQTDILENQDPWAESDKAERLLELLPDKELNDALRKKWDADPGRPSSRKWADIDSLAKMGASKNLDTTALRDAKQDIVLEYTYPRLDAEVSKKQIHLLKSPFVVHPSTGRVCVPIDTKRLEKFDPLGVPTATELLAEIDDWEGENRRSDDEREAKKLQDYEKTSLKPYMEYFISHVSNLLRGEKGVKRERDEGDAMEF